MDRPIDEESARTLLESLLFDSAAARKYYLERFILDTYQFFSGIDFLILLILYAYDFVPLSPHQISMLSDIKPSTTRYYLSHRLLPNGAVTREHKLYRISSLGEKMLTFMPIFVYIRLEDKIHQILASLAKNADKRLTRFEGLKTHLFTETGAHLDFLFNAMMPSVEKVTDKHTAERITSILSELQEKMNPKSPKTFIEEIRKKTKEIKNAGDENLWRAWKIACYLVSKFGRFRKDFDLKPISYTLTKTEWKKERRLYLGEV